MATVTGSNTASAASVTINRRETPYRPLPALGAIRLNRLLPEHVATFKNAMLKRRLAPRTVELSLVILRAVLDQALRFGLVARNVAKLVDTPRSKRAPIRPLDPEQTRRLIATLKGHRFEALYIAALALGIRRGACLGMRWRDIDLENQTYAVGQALAIQRIGRPGTGGQGSSLQLVEQKSVANRAAMPLPEIVVKALKERRTTQLRERLAAGSSWIDNNLVFATRRGTPIEPRRIHHAFKTLLAKAAPLTTRFHDLRHGVASLLIATGEHPRVVMEWLGHSQISLTMNTYAHVMPVAMRDVAAKLDAVLGQGVLSVAHRARWGAMNGYDELRCAFFVPAFHPRTQWFARSGTMGTMIYPLVG